MFWVRLSILVIVDSHIDSVAPAVQSFRVDSRILRPSRACQLVSSISRCRGISRSGHCASTCEMRRNGASNCSMSLGYPPKRQASLCPVASGNSSPIRPTPEPGTPSMTPLSPASKGGRCPRNRPGRRSRTQWGGCHADGGNPSPQADHHGRAGRSRAAGRSDQPHCNPVSRSAAAVINNAPELICPTAAAPRGRRCEARGHRRHCR